MLLLLIAIMMSATITIATNMATTAAAMPTVRPMLPSFSPGGDEGSVDGDGLGTTTDLVLKHSGSGTKSPELFNIVQAAGNPKVTSTKTHYSHLRISMFKSEQQWSSGAMYSPVLEQLIIVTPNLPNICSLLLKYSVSASNSSGHR